MRMVLERAWLRLWTFLRLYKSFARNGLRVFVPFLFVLVLLKVFFFFSSLTAPVMPFVYSLF